MTPPTLLALFGVLSSIESSPRERNQACRELDALLRQRLPGLLRDVGGLSEEDREDTLQHLLMQASTGTARCQATSEGEAWGWCRTVARNFALDLLGKQSRFTHSEKTLDDATAESSNDLGTQQELDVVQLQIARAKQAIERSPRGKDKLASVTCAVDYCLHGATVEDQISRWAFPGGPPATPTAQELRRARDRVYAYRSRGVRYLLETLDEFEKSREFDAHELQFLRRLLEGMRR